MGRPAIAKERFRKTYRHSTLDQRLTKQRTVAEARSCARVRRLGIRTPLTYLTDVSSGLVVMERLSGCTAKEEIKRLTAAGDHAALIGLASSIGDVVARLHAGGLVHGDLTTSNIFCCDSRSSSGEPAAAAADADADADAEVEAASSSSSSSSSSSFSASSASSASASSSSSSPRAPAAAAASRFELALIDFGLTRTPTQVDEDRGVDLYVMERAFLSTHPRSEALFAEVMRAYEHSEAWKDDAGTKRRRGSGRQGVRSTLRHLEKVRARGRKRLAFG